MTAFIVLDSASEKDESMGGEGGELHSQKIVESFTQSCKKELNWLVALPCSAATEIPRGEKRVQDDLSFATSYLDFKCSGI